MSARPPRRAGGVLLPTVVLVMTLCPLALATDPAATDGKPKPPPEPEVITATTSDGVPVSAWYYEAPGDGAAVATVLALHDLGGSHKSLEPLALSLQAAGCSVVVPDLRGHGKSSIARLERAAGDTSQAEMLKSGDFLAMTATAGGRVRDQSSVRGDVESIRNEIKKRGDGEKLTLNKFYLVGSGLGAAVAAGWSVADASWPSLASGPQGGDVKGLVLIDPAFVTKGFSIAKILGVEPVKSLLPVMVIAGDETRDAAKVFDQLKRARPNGWFDNRLFDAETRRNTSPAKDSEASLIFLKLGSRLTGDKLASFRAADARQPDPARLILAFIKSAADRGR